MRLLLFALICLPCFLQSGQIPYYSQNQHLQRFFPYAFEGNVQIKSQVLFEKLEAAQVGRQSAASEIPLILDVLKKTYASLGYHNTTIRMEYRGRLKILQIREGSIGYIDRIALQGMPEHLVERCLKRLKQRLLNSNGETLFGRTERNQVASMLNGLISKPVVNLQSEGKKNIDSHKIAMIYTPENLAILDEEIRSVLDGAGYLNAKIFGPKLLWDSSQRMGAAHFRIRSGRQAVLEKVIWIQDKIHDAIIEARISGMLGKLLNKHAVSRARDEIERHLLNSGYVKPRVSIYLNANSKSQNVEVEIDVKKGVRSKIDVIETRGSERTSSRVFEHEILIRPGEYFSWDKFQASRFNLLRLDIFSQVNLQMYAAENGLSKKQILVALVEEKPRFLFDLGAGISLEDGPRLQAKFRIRNIWGLAGHLDTNLQLNYPAVFYGLGFVYAASAQKALTERFEGVNGFEKALLFTEGKLIVALDFPKIYPWTPNLGAKIYSVMRREIRVAYTLNQVLVRLSGRANLGKYFSLGPTVEGSYSYFDCALPGYFPGGRCGETGVVARHRLDAGLVEEISLGLFLEKKALKDPAETVSLEGRFDAYFGIGSANLYGERAGASGEYDRLLKDIRYFKFHAKSKFTWSLTRYLDSISKVQFGGLINTQKNSYVPLFERFYLGGGASLRGFPEDQILPADDPLWPTNKPRPTAEDPETILSQGGHFLISVQTEIRFPMSEKLSGAVFADAGQLLNQIEHFYLGGFALGVGLGVRYKLPIGELKLDFAMKMIDGKRRTFQSLGEAFGVYFSLEPG